MGRRTLSLVASLLLAAVGVAIIGLYIRGADQRANARAEQIYGPRPTPSPAPSPMPTNGHDDISHLGISVEIADPDRAWVLLAPGDMVALYATTRQGKAERIIDGIRVIAVGPRRAVHGVDAPVPSTIIALDADDQQTRDILAAQAAGTLSVAVLGRSTTR